MIKILFLINSLGGGGAERVLVNLVNYMDKEKFDITVETMFSDGVNRDSLSRDVKYVCKHAPEFSGVSHAMKFFSSRKMYKYFIGDEHYDIIVAYMHGAPTKIVAGCRDKDTKLVTFLHNGDPKTGSFFKFWINEKDGVEAYRKMDALAGVCSYVAEEFEKYTGLKTDTVYNVNDTERILRMAEEPCSVKVSKEKITICTAGRIEGNKGYDRLADSASWLINEGLDFEILIMGTGADDEKLKAQIRDLELEDHIKLLGYCDNPYSIMKASDAYILSSRTEGLPTVVTEALTVGIPVVATDVSGVRELLGDNSEYGLIVPNSTEGIYEGLKRIITDEGLRNRYKATAKQRAEIFDTAHTVKKAEVFFEGLLY